MELLELISIRALETGGQHRAELSIGQTQDLGRDIVTLENLTPDGIDHLAVTVNDIVVLDDVLTGVKVVALDSLLSRLQCLADWLS